MDRQENNITECLNINKNKFHSLKEESNLKKKHKIKRKKTLFLLGKKRVKSFGKSETNSLSYLNSQVSNLRNKLKANRTDYINFLSINTFSIDHKMNLIKKILQIEIEYDNLKHDLFMYNLSKEEIKPNLHFNDIDNENSWN